MNAQDSKTACELAWLGRNLCSAISLRRIWQAARSATWKPSCAGNTPERGMVMPSQFIPGAEASGLIVPLGRWVLRQACAQCRAWREAGLHRLRVHVNFSTAQFKRDDVIATVSEVLAEFGLPPDAIGLEVTESLLTSDFRPPRRRFIGCGSGVRPQP